MCGKTGTSNDSSPRWGRAKSPAVAAAERKEETASPTAGTYLDWGFTWLFSSDRADEHEWKNTFDQAIICFDAAINLDPTLAAAYYWRGYAYLNYPPMDIGRAMADFNKVIEIAPDFVDAYMRRGEIYLSCLGWEDIGRALADFTKVVKIAPDFFSGYWMRSDAYSKMGDYKRALADLCRLYPLVLADYDFWLRSDSPSNYPYNLIRGYLGAMGDAINAGFDCVTALTKIIKSKPKDMGGYAVRGLLYSFREEDGDYDRAIADFTQAIKLAPKPAGLYLCRGRVYHEKGDFNKAVADYEQVLKAYPSANIQRELEWAKKRELP